MDFNRRNFLTLLPVAILAGCTKTNSQPEPKDHRQECQMCGAIWFITPDDPSEVIPPTVEWCFHDGTYCQVGLKLLIEQQRNDETQEPSERMIEHCRECQGCRCATFTPSEWAEINR